MTLLITVFAALTASVLWYRLAPKKMYLGTLSLIYWSASLMWLVDAVFEYAELKAEYFNPAPLDMLNDAFLGFCVVAFGLIIWLGIVIIKDPKKVIRQEKQ